MAENMRIIITMACTTERFHAWIERCVGYEYFQSSSEPLPPVVMNTSRFCGRWRVHLRPRGRADLRHVAPIRGRRVIGRCNRDFAASRRDLGAISARQTVDWCASCDRNE